MSEGAVLFIHGVGGSGLIWHNQIKYFNEKGFATLAFDMVGHGQSPISVDYSVCHHQDEKYQLHSSTNSIYTCFKCPDIGTIRDQCHFDELFKDTSDIFDTYIEKWRRESHSSNVRSSQLDATSLFLVVVAAHSYGTSFAVRLAKSREALVDRLILISGGAPTPLEPDLGVLALPSACLALCSPLIHLAVRRIIFAKRKYVSNCKDDEFPDASKSVDERVFTIPVQQKHTYSLNVHRITDDEINHAFSLNSYALWATMSGQVWPDGDGEFYATLRMPVLLISGEKDHLVTEEEDLETLHNLQRGQLKRVRGAGHMCMLEDPDTVNRIMETFIYHPPNAISYCNRRPHSGGSGTVIIRPPSLARNAVNVITKQPCLPKPVNTNTALHDHTVSSPLGSIS